ncbi:MAG: tripartite tricarboxylate transporter substrate binding protein [Rhodospirillales bacterium]|nr:MAG: tripartite tricarboxylate transporter substrate binding protein [Rhodospirillales bacterium]
MATAHLSGLAVGSALTRRGVAGGLALAPLAAAAQPAGYPDRPVRLVVGFPPGGPNDLLSRILAPRVGELLRQTVVVENKSGSNGEIATAFVAKAPPDGYTLGMATNGSTTIAPAIGRKLPYDARVDLAAVALVASSPMLLVVRNDLPAASLTELLRLARERPGTLNAGSAGSGSPTHLGLELLKSMAGVDIVHVPYKGGGPLMIDLMAGQIDLYFGGLTTALPHVRSGTLRALAVTSLARSAAAPEIPTLAESGLAGYDAGIWYGIFAPAGTPSRIVDRLHAVFAEAVRSPDVLRQFAEHGADPRDLGPAALARFVVEDMEKWTRLARAARIVSD